MDIVVVDEQTLRCGDQTYRCAIGQAGFAQPHDKREGDLKTPRGIYPLRACYYRADKVDRPQTDLPLVEIRPDMGWCDDLAHSRYNQLVRVPAPLPSSPRKQERAFSYENMWREDDCYDLVVTIGYNDHPIISGMGSAIFMHVVKPDFSGTEGCVALSKADVQEILRVLSSDSSIQIMP